MGDVGEPLRHIEVEPATEPAVEPAPVKNPEPIPA